MKSFRCDLLESIETFEDAKRVVSEWLMGGVELETVKSKLFENMYLSKKAPEILEIRNSIVEKMSIALQSLNKVTITESNDVMTDTYNNSVKSIEESINKALTRNEKLVWKIIDVLKESTYGVTGKGVGKLGSMTSGKVSQATKSVGKFNPLAVGSKITGPPSAVQKAVGKPGVMKKTLTAVTNIAKTKKGKGAAIGAGLAAAGAAAYGAKKAMDKKEVNNSKRKR